MSRLSELDLTIRLAPAVPRAVTQVSVGLFTAATAILFYTALDRLTVGDGAPFALCFPAMMLATLFARPTSAHARRATCVGDGAGPSATTESHEVA